MGISDFFKKLFQKEEEQSDVIQNNEVVNDSLEIDDEDRVVVALAASIMAGKDKPDSHFHISSIRRIK